MHSLQDVFARLQHTKKEQKRINRMYKDSLDAVAEYKLIADKIKDLKIKKKEIEDMAKADLGSEYVRLEALKADALNDKQLLADLVLNSLVKGEPVVIKGEGDEILEPVFSVNFKKNDEVKPLDS